MVLDVIEGALCGHELHFGAAALGGADHRQRRHGNTVMKFHLVHLAVTPDAQLQPLRQRIDYRHTDAVQATRDLVRILIELTARMQLGHHDFGRRTLQFVVLLDVSRNATAIVDDRDGIVCVDDNFDVVTVTRQRLVDGIVQDFEHHMMQASAVGSVADIHAGAFAHRVQAFEHLDAIRIVIAAVVDGFRIRFGHASFSRCGPRCKAPAPTRGRRRALASNTVADIRYASASQHTCNRCALA